MTALALSVLLALVSSVCYAAGAILQERVAATAPQETYAPLRRGGWWGAVSLNGAGAVLHVLALAYGPLSVVQPLGALTIVFALPMAALFVRREVGAAGWRGALLATAGLAGLLSLTGSAPGGALAGAERVAVAVATAGALAALAAAARFARRPAARSVLLATAAGTAFGISSVFTKDVATAWSWGSWGGGTLPGLVMIALLAAAGVFLSQASYRGAGLAAPLATATVVNPVVATVVGMTALGEHFRHGVPGTLLAVAAAVVASAGLALLTSHGAEGAGGTAGSDPVGTAAPGRSSGDAGPNPAPRAPERAGGRPVLPAVPAQPGVVRQVRRAGAGPADIGVFPPGSAADTPPADTTGPVSRAAAGPWSGGVPTAFPGAAAGVAGAVPGRRTVSPSAVVVGAGSPRSVPTGAASRGAVGRGTPVGGVRFAPDGRARGQGMLQPQSHG